ncbi:MAG: VWA domain-containing protein [Bdellovibrionales bacterium]|nr:VWA domain-containing protein [Bdellovibrionales bacterium]
MKFANPEAFLLLAPVALFAWYTWTVGVRRRSRVDYPTGTWIDARPRLTLISPFRLHFALRLVALVLMVVALARPQAVFTKTNRTVDAVDMIICFDLSKSMDAVDFYPNRHELAVTTINSFIDKRTDDRIGLVLFSGEAYLAVPITHDHDILKNAIETSSNRYLSDGTAIGQALAVAANHLRDSKAKSKVIVLVTDGDNNMGSVDPVTAAELAKAFGVKIYTIGLGKKGRVRLPVKVTDPLTGQTMVSEQWLTDAVNEELLEDIANRTGGKAFRAAEDGVLAKIFASIDTLERTRVETNTVTRFSELGWPWILFAFALLASEGIALNTRWRKIP